MPRSLPVRVDRRATLVTAVAVGLAACPATAAVAQRSGPEPGGDPDPGHIGGSRSTPRTTYPGATVRISGTAEYFEGPRVTAPGKTRIIITITRRSPHLTFSHRSTPDWTPDAERRPTWDLTLQRKRDPGEPEAHLARAYTFRLKVSNRARIGRKLCFAEAWSAVDAHGTVLIGPRKVFPARGSEDQTCLTVRHKPRSNR